MAQHALQARLDAAISDAIDTLIHDVIDDALATATLAVRSEAQVAEAKAHDSLPTSSTSPMSSLDEAWELDAPPPLPDPVPAWREPTQIISGSEPPSTATAREELPEPREPETAGSMYVAELRRTMSAIEQRLFGRRAGEAAVDSLRAQEPQELEMPSDIDLDSLGVDTHPGLGASPVRIPRGRTPPPLIEDDVVVEDVEHELQRRGAGRAFGPTHGDLADEDAAMLLSRLFRESWSGRITFRHEGTEKAVFLESGRPVFATSNHPVDRMGDLLFREGKITREQYAKSTEIVVGTGRRMGEILVEMGFLKRRELLPAVRRHVEDIIYSVFGWEAGQFQLIAGDMAQDEKIRLTKHPTALVMEGVRRKISGERILNRLGGQSAVLLPLKSRVEMLSALADAELTAEEQHALELFDGTRSIEGIVSVAILPEDSVFQLAHGLLALGLARRVDRARDAESLTPSPTPSGSGTADARIDRERVLAKHALVEEADYCTVLGVRRDASAFEIRRAYEAARRDYSLPTFPVEVQRELAEPLREIAVVLDEAYRVLHDDDIRAQYLHHLKD
ncbi:MAG: DUF4388 domain-containing protein [Deltaproteobacteria bacterium]|nr:DUF4388 domain-containing protein [Deltaproteobacteria bacterium]